MSNWSLWRERQTVVLWNVDPKDWACRSPAEMHEWFRRRPLQGGDVVLMHDDRPHAADVLPVLIADARAKGLSFGLVSQWTR